MGYGRFPGMLGCRSHSFSHGPDCSRCFLKTGKWQCCLGPLMTLPSTRAYPVDKGNYLKCWSFLKIQAIFPAFMLKVIITTVKMSGRKHGDRFGDKTSHSTLGLPSFQMHVLATGPHLSELARNAAHNLL